MQEDQAIAQEKSLQSSMEPEPESSIHSIVYHLPVDHQGTFIYIKGWAGEETFPPVIIVHDIGETSGAYRELLRGLADRGYPAYVYDQRGHGRSGRSLGHVESFQEFTSDLLQVVAWIRYKCHRKKPILIGHGIGALIVSYFLLNGAKYVSGSIMIGPIFMCKTTSWQRFVLRLWAEFLPTFRIGRRLMPKAFLSSHLTNVRLTSKLVEEVVTAMLEVDETFFRIESPIMLIPPKKRKGANFKKTRLLCDNHPRMGVLEVADIALSRSEVVQGSKKLELVLEIMDAYLKKILFKVKDQPNR